jgi:cyclopropane-fatty-acyl-phospholipid synthase
MESTLTVGVPRDIRMMASMNLAFIGAVMSSVSPTNFQSLTPSRFSYKGRAHDTAPLLDAVFHEYAGPAFAIRFWDDSIWYSSTEDVGFRIYLHSQEAWNALSATPDELSLGKKYIAGEIDVEGDLFLALRALPAIRASLEDYISSSALSFQEFAKLLLVQISRMLHWGPAHSKRRDAASISYHYDKPSSFYQLFLGPSMVYSCAYFQDWNDDLVQAQNTKMDMICRKLNLQADDRFMDIGCGWGSLVLRAVQKHGVIGCGASLSNQQVNYGIERIARANLTKRAAIYWSDFRDLSEVHSPFNKLASVGMCEHVGRAHIDAYFQEAFKLLLPGGLFLNHGITRSAQAPSKGPSFINQYVFPDGELLTLTEMVRAAEEAGFEVRDVEDLREHYEETLHRWVDALCQHEREATELTDLETFRIWKLYMAGSSEAFRRGDIAVYQLLLSKNIAGKSHATSRREQWYRNS